MGKNKKNNKNNKKTKNTHPFVSICTPTFNRRPFFDSIIKCINHQTYPKDNMEWVIIDDGTDKIEDLVKDHPLVKYFYYPEKLTLGKKRNIMHEKSKGEILVYMDDDDYYPPTRVSHAVEKLLGNPKALCAASSELYVYFKHVSKMIQFGPYNANHGTAGTFAFKRKLLEITKYNEAHSLAEEKEFLKEYTIPMVQLDPKQVILVFSHDHNTFDKKKLLDGPSGPFRKESDKTVDDFIKQPDLKDFFMNKIDKMLENYDEGKPDKKPDVLKQLKEIDEKRKNMANQQLNNVTGIMIKQNDGSVHNLTIHEAQNIINSLQSKMNELSMVLQQKDKYIQLLQTKLSSVPKI